MHAGYAIVEVERGWATFIAGSVAFSCGIVTLALGLILHRLSGLHALFKSGQGLSPTHEPSPAAPFEASSAPVPPRPAAPSSPAGVGSGVRNWPTRPMRSHLAAARSFLKSRVPMSRAARGTGESDYAPPKSPPLSREGPKPDYPTSEPPFEPSFTLPGGMAFGREEEEQRRRDFPPAGPTPAEFEWRLAEQPELFDEERAADKIEEPSSEQFETGYHTSEQDGQQGAAWPTETASIETLFDERLLFELDAALESRTEAEDLTPEGLEPADRTPEPPAEEAALEEPSQEPPAPTSGQGELAIVGQYESEGTSYIMYSDGSIEARTEHAVFHFKSIAELKAFMESGTPTQHD